MEKPNRILKILYGPAYAFSLVIFADVWLHFAPICLAGSCFGSMQQAIGYALAASLLYLILLRLIKILTLYFVSDIKPNWRREFRKIF